MRSRILQKNALCGAGLSFCCCSPATGMAEPVSLVRAYRIEAPKSPRRPDGQVRHTDLCSLFLTFTM